MNCEYVTVYNQDGEMLGVLENAGEVAYNLVHNDLWTASFTLPSGDPKNSLCQAHNLVHLSDGARDTGLYRIIGMPSGEETAAGGVKTYSLEHVMATLLDDVLFGYHEIGGPGVTTAQVIQYILDQQHTERWVLGECEYSDQYAYKFENTSLLSALLSLGNVLTDEYTWVFDTSASPWTVSLKHADATPGCGIHYRRNMVEVEKEMDASTLVTRLYMLGYGEGVNQLTIRDINGGVPYIDADTKNVWGVKSSVYADTRIEDAATLKARGVALLNRLKNPYISYTASAVDLTRLTGQEWDKHMPGKLVRVLDGEHGIDFDARIVSIAKGDVRGTAGRDRHHHRQRAARRGRQHQHAGRPHGHQRTVQPREPRTCTASSTPTTPTRSTRRRCAFMCPAGACASIKCCCRGRWKPSAPTRRARQRAARRPPPRPAAGPARTRPAQAVPAAQRPARAVPNRSRASKRA